MLPKFLIADNPQEAPEFVYVVHNDTPRCIIQSHVSDFNYMQEIHWIDEKPEDKKPIDRLLAEAKEFWLVEMDSSDEEYEDDFADDDVDF